MLDTIRTMLQNFSKVNRYQKATIILYDFLSIVGAWFLAYWFRFNLHWIPGKYRDKFLLAIPILLSVQLVSYAYFNLYRGVWRFSSLHDIWSIIKSVVIATIASLSLMVFIHTIEYIPRSVWPMYAVILIAFMCGGRLLIRSLFEQGFFDKKNHKAQKVLVIGAGQAGESLVREIKRHSNVHYDIKGFLDDSIDKSGLEIQGIRVLGHTKQLHDFCRHYGIDLIFIAIPSLSSRGMRRLVDLCEHANTPFRTLPSLIDIASGNIDINSLREVKIDDLLGRDQVKINWSEISNTIQDKRVVVTGGGGSIGSELCRQIAQLNPKALLIIDNSEYNLYRIEHELSMDYPDLRIEVSLCSVLDKASLKTRFQRFNPEVVFHAAAYKHVPLLEEQVTLAVQNNIFGTKVMVELSAEFKVHKFILISTDKAVNPTNIMGMTKRVAEIYCQNYNQFTNTEFITVRFGNVLGSNGSVVPLFKQQLKTGGPITVTHPDITRYFMTIPEASRLILQAMINGGGGEIFVLDMGEPIKINYLAEQLIRLAGKEPGVDIEIKYTGLRPGEKLYEELFHEHEQLEPTYHEKILKAKYRQVNWERLSQSLVDMHQLCEQQQEQAILSELMRLVPEYSGDRSLGPCLEELSVSA